MGYLVPHKLIRSAMKWYYIFFKRNLGFNDASYKTICDLHKLTAWGAVIVSFGPLIAGIQNILYSEGLPFCLEFIIFVMVISLATRFKGLASFTENNFVMVNLTNRQINFADILWIFEFSCDPGVIEKDAKIQLVLKSKGAFFPYNLHILTVPSSAGFYQAFQLYKQQASSNS